MNAPGSPRFRIRTPDGGVEAVGSVEALSEKVEAGEVGPETQLYDNGTGQWNRAGDVPVFQFVVEELRAEGRLGEGDVGMQPDPVLPPEPVDVEPVDPGVDFAPIEHESSDGPDLAPPVPPTVDPFELHLPLGTPDPWSGAQGRASSPDPRDAAGEGPADDDVAGPGAEGVADEPDEAQEPLEPWFEDRPYQRAGGAEEADDGGPEAASGADGADPEPDPEPDPGSGPESDVETGDDGAGRTADWITHGPPVPRVAARLAAEEPDDAPARDAGEPGFDGRFGSAAPEDLPGLRPAAPPDPPEATGLIPPSTSSGGADAEPPLVIRTAWEDAAEEEDPRAARIAARRRQRNLRVVGGLGALVLVAVGISAAVAAFRSASGPADASAPLAGAPALSPPSAQAAPLPEDLDLPAGLEAEAEALWAALPQRINRIVDSLRVEAGLPETPPREWLSGFYMANADEFAAVPGFWRAYEGFVAELQARDEALVRQAADEHLDTRALPGPDRRRMVLLLEARRPEVAPVRDERYRNLRRTADEALAFHEFLVLNTSLIRYAPALGGGVSADPVLEAVAETPEVRRQLEAHLDRIFGALDRTRAGGQPSPSGLRVELFGNLGYPL